MSTTCAAPVDVTLDHVGFIVQDLDASSGLVAQLGFTLTARADHSRTDANGVSVSTGSSQRSIMLENGYIELMQITDPGAGHQLAAAPTVRFGLHVVAFGTSDAQACHTQCLSNGVSAGPVLHWARPVDEPGARGLARFAYFGAAWNALDPSYLCWVEHCSPELMRPPQLLRHSNGALGLVELHYRGPRHLALAWSARLLAAGARLACETPEALVLSLPNAAVRIDIDAGATTLAASALRMDFSDCGGLRQRCAELGLAHRELQGGALDIDLTAQLGMHWICGPAAAAVN